MSIDRMGASSDGSESPQVPPPSPVSIDSSEPRDSIEAQLARARRELDAMRAMHGQMMELIGCEKPEKLVHDLRNVLNELHLLRMLSDAGKC